MVSENIKYEFKNILNGLESFVADISLKLNYINLKLPTFILQAGNTQYYFDKKFIESSEAEIYLKVPRFVISIENIQNQLDDNTNPYNKIVYKYQDKEYISTSRRISLNIVINTSYVSSNFIKALENYEIMLSIMSKPNLFTYEFLGNTYEGSYNQSSFDIQKPPLDSSSVPGNFSVNVPIDLQLQITVPRIESIQTKDITNIQLDINTDNNTYNLYINDN